MSDLLNELQWRAFRYIADELTPQERGEFEIELSQQQAAREAVAEMVELTETISLASCSMDSDSLEKVGTASVSLAASHESGWSQPAIWFAAASALSLAIVFSALFMFNGNGRETANHISTIDSTTKGDLVSPGDSSILAIAWSEVHDDFLSSVDLDTDDLNMGDEEAWLDDAETLATDHEDELAEQLATPFWMYVAVEPSLEEGELGTDVHVEQK